KIQSLFLGEFILNDWAFAGLNVVTAVKRGIYTVHEDLVIKVIGQLIKADQLQVDKSLKLWLDL
ncbi:MAG: MazF family transcriptional regulator, partial [Microcystaceae cyanobacterium]